MLDKMQFEDNGLIQTIQESVKTEKIDVEVGDYTTRQVYRVDEQPLAQAMAIHSLTGLVNYINEHIDVNAREDAFVHVLDPTTVKLRCQINSNEDRRFTPVIAEADPPDIPFGQWLRHAEFMVMLQSRFQDTISRAVLLEQIGNICADEELQQKDDGVGQEITIQKGVNRSGSEIKNPVMLRPFRTFAEIDPQPESAFILRIRKDDSSGILVGLFEADGGAWKNEARVAIKTFLDAKISVLEKLPVIA